MFENLVEALSGTPYYVAVEREGAVYVFLCTHSEGIVSGMFKGATLDQAALKLAGLLADEDSGILLTPDARQRIEALVELWR